MDISQAKAIITGGASGLGLAAAKRIVAEGGKVTLLDVNHEQGEASATELGATFVRTDVSDEHQVRAAVAAGAEHMGGITLALNCAGIIGAARALGREGPMAADFFLNVLKINLLGSFIVAKEAAQLMQNNEPSQDGERGVIISTASIAAFEGQIGQAAYSASKGGVASMALPLAREFARIGVRVNTVAPGIFYTPMMHGLPEEAQQSLAAQVPFPPRLGRPEEFADAVAFIYGNAMVNAETIRIDGAIRMQPK